MGILSQDRIEDIKDIACKFLLQNNIHSFPVDVDKLYEVNGWYLDSIHAAEILTGVLSPCFMNNNHDFDPITCLYSEKYITLYKTSGSIPERVLWSKAHELGEYRTKTY